KLHGDIEQPGTIVITTNDYIRMLTGDPAVLRHLRSELESRTVLFLGYRFNDDDLKQILSLIGHEMADLRRNMFTLQINPTSLAVKSLTKLGLEVIAITTVQPHHNITEALTNWLRQF